MRTSAWLIGLDVMRGGASLVPLLVLALVLTGLVWDNVVWDGAWS